MQGMLEMVDLGAVNNLSRDAGNLLAIAGTRDQVVKPETSRELLELAEDRGATVLRNPSWAIPSWTTILSNGWKPCADFCYMNNLS